MLEQIQQFKKHQHFAGAFFVVLILSGIFELLDNLYHDDNFELILMITEFDLNYRVILHFLTIEPKRTVKNVEIEQ